jgi:ubiquinone/menaquinone biosynthesis C-methylase UbiE
MKLNLGSGIYPADGYINIDSDPSVKPDILRDVRRGLPFNSDMVDEVRAYHFLEHLAPEDFIFALTEVYRVLKDSGIFDIRVPLGITDDPTHKTFFTEGSFNVFLDVNSQFNYRNNMNWELVSKKVIREKFPTLHIVLRCLKRGETR